MRKLIDLTGKRFGKLLVIEKSKSRRDKRGMLISVWLCECDCGNKVIVRHTHLITNNTQSCGCYHIERVKKSLFESTREKVYRNYKQNANKKNISFELTKEEFFKLTKQNCFYCGNIPSNISKSRNNNGDYVYNGIDRIDNSKGYIKENVVSCCFMCNQAKHNHSQKEFYEWIEKVYKYKFS